MLVCCHVILLCCIQSKYCVQRRFEKLKLKFNACARYIYNVHKYCHISHKTNIILGCLLENFYKMSTLLFIFIHRQIKNQSPGYLFESLTPSPSNRIKDNNGRGKRISKFSGRWCFSSKRAELSIELRFCLTH